MKVKQSLPLFVFLLVTVVNSQAGIIFGQPDGIPEKAAITYVARVGKNWQEILTEDGFNSKLGINGGYQRGRFLLNAENFTKIRKGEKVVIEFTCIAGKKLEVGSISVRFDGSFQDVGTISFKKAETPFPPPKPQVKITGPGVVQLSWKSERKLTYYVYRSTQASGTDNLASNGRYQLIAAKVKPPFIDKALPTAMGTQAWYIIMAEDSSGRKSGHSEEAYVPDTSM